MSFAIKHCHACLATLCAFANDLNPSPDKSIHPLVRAVILHFTTGDDHPFVDDDGRTARTLFYWSVLRQKYRLMEFISVSSIKRLRGKKGSS